MDRVVDVTAIVARQISNHVAIGIDDADSYFLHDDTKRTYSFITVPRNDTQDSLIVMLARVTDDDRVIIETDHTDLSLYDELIDEGIPRAHIIRAYAGKTQPEL